VASGFEARDRPARVLCHQRFGILSRRLQSWQHPAVARVPQRHAHIASEAAPPNALYGGAGKTLLEAGLVQR
jgi:hypothetical protein